MAEDTKKGLVAAGVIATLLALLLRRKAAAAGGPAATISAITILDEMGNPVPKNSPATVYTGGTYYAAFSVGNASTQLGAPVQATLTITASGAGISLTGVPGAIIFGRGQSLEFTISFTVTGLTGTFGDFTAYVLDPLGTVLASATESLTITTAPVIYGATITPITVS